MDAATSRKLTNRGKERRRQLIDEAVRLFAANGYHPTSVADIVGSLGVGKGVFYWYFESKEQLFLEILRESQTDLRRAQRDAIAGEPDPVRRLELGVRAAFRWWAEHPEITNLVQFAATEAGFARALRRGQEVALGDAAAHIKDAITAGEVRDEDPDVLAHAVIAVTTHFARELVQRQGEDPEATADLAMSLLLDGLRP